MQHKWKNVPGNLTLEVVKEDGYWDIGKGEEIPKVLADAISVLFPDQTEFQVEINFLSTGYYAPAKLYGPPEKCYPEEGDDERVLDDIVVSPAHENSMTGYNEKMGKKIPQPAADTIFDLYMDDITEVELESQDDGGREYERDY